MLAESYGAYKPETYRGRPVLQKPFAKDDLERVLKTLAV